MSDEREPLLSDDDVWEAIGISVRDFYEDLITTGKLRVVDGDADVMLVDVGGFVDGRWKTLDIPGKDGQRIVLRVVEEVELDGNIYCSGCGQWCGDDGLSSAPSDAMYDFCPGCGNKIKRP